MSVIENDPGAPGAAGPAEDSDDFEPKDMSSEDLLAELGGVEIRYTPLKPDEITSEIQKHLQADGPRRMMMARNLVPLPAKDMGLVLFCLMNDENPKIREAAEDSMDSLPPNILRTTMGQPLPWKVLDFLTRNFYEDEDPNQIIETVALNRAAGPETMMLLARVGSPKILDLLINNQARLQEMPQLISEFPKNPRISVAQLSRALEFGRRQNIITVDMEDRLIDGFINKAKKKEEVVPLERVVTEVQDESGEIDWEFPSFMTADFEADMELDAEAEIIEDKINSKLNMRELIRQMTVPQKMRLGTRGNMEARKIIVMDKLALVAKSVLANPRITNTEIEVIAASRLIEPEVLELLARNAAWTRSYAVRHELVCNPKFPLHMASKMLGTLFEKDIKTISKSRAVPAAIQSIARQRLEAQEQRRKKRETKKKK